MIENYYIQRRKYNISKKSWKKVCINKKFLYNTQALEINGLLAQ